MPLSVNVGLSRKTSADFQSAGASINVTAELDQALLAKPEELQRQIHQLYSQAESALEHQASTTRLPEPPPRESRYEGRRSPNSRYDRGNGNGGQRSNGNGGGSMTHAQRRAILSIGERLGIDPRLEARDIIGVEFDDLSIRQASELIDHLKGLQQPAQRRR